MGRGVPGDEALLVHVGGTDHPAEQNYFRVRKNDYRGGGWMEGAWGEPYLAIELSEVSVTVVRRADAERHVPRSGT